jgi:2-dehydropantoate 2-reductase
MAQQLHHSPHVLIFGVGAVGSTVGGWLVEAGAKVTFFARGATAESLAQNGITLHRGAAPALRTNLRVQVATDLAAIERPDIVVLTVKNYSLDAVARQVKNTFGDHPIIVGLQNGVENQSILPLHFSKVVFGVVHYNSWIDSPGSAGYQKKGPLVFGVLNSAHGEILTRVMEVFIPAVECHAAPRLQDAVYSKLILNLTNSLTALIGFPEQPVSDTAVFQKLLNTVTFEGVSAVSKAGFQEYKVKGSPTWLLIKAGAKLPGFLTRSAFNKNVGKLHISSMAQDIGRGNEDTELESLNGSLLALAAQHGVPVPVNQAVYRLCRERFARKPFLPMDVRDVWAAVQTMTI